MARTKTIEVKGGKRPVHKDVTIFSVRGLGGETEFAIFMVTDYEGD